MSFSSVSAIGSALRLRTVKDVKRYAKGEIDKEEFERKKNDLKS
jgi:uncharacterized membrane protein